MQFGKIKLTYVGKRLTEKNALLYFWADEESETQFGFKRNSVFANIGDKYEFTKANEEGTSVFTGGEKMPVACGHSFDQDFVLKCIAKEAVCIQELAQIKAENKYKARETEFAKALKPLKQLLDQLPFHDDRAFFIARITSELWRR